MSRVNIPLSINVIFAHFIHIHFIVRIKSFCGYFERNGIQHGVDLLFIGKWSLTLGKGILLG